MLSTCHGHGTTYVPVLTVAAVRRSNSKHYTNKLGYVLLLATSTVLTSLTSELGRIPTVLYVQIGKGASSHFSTRKAPSSFRHSRSFMDQLDNLVEHLDIHDNSDLFKLGHAWGDIQSLWPH
jgi:hypothetical protein